MTWLTLHEHKLLGKIDCAPVSASKLGMMLLLCLVVALKDFREQYQIEKEVLLHAWLFYSSTLIDCHWMVSNVFCGRKIECHQVGRLNLKDRRDSVIPEKEVSGRYIAKMKFEVDLVCRT